MHTPQEFLRILNFDELFYIENVPRLCGNRIYIIIIYAADAGYFSYLQAKTTTYITLSDSSFRNIIDMLSQNAFYCVM